jgi:hypothetical protein
MRRIRAEARLLLARFKNTSVDPTRQTETNVFNLRSTQPRRDQSRLEGWNL